MNILLTNRTLEARTGTEIVTRDLAVALHRIGHRVCVYAPYLGEIAVEIRQSGVPVVTSLKKVPFVPDIIHGHHHVETTLATLQFPATPAIFVCHDRLNWHDSPPLTPAVRRFVAVDRNCRERLVLEASIDSARTHIVGNAIDLDRFHSRAALPERPRRALLFSNYARPGTALDPFRQACDEAGLELTVIGSGVEASARQPEALLGDFDIVFGKARCALEAMASGCAVILCDTAGLGAMVTSDSVGQLREWNFGMRCVQRPLHVPDILREIARYDAADAARVTKWIRGRCGLGTAVNSYLMIYGEVIAEGPVTVTDAVASELELRVRNIGAMEARLRPAPEPLRTGEPIAIRIAGAVERIPPGEVAQLSLSIENRSAETLATLPPYPARIASRWLDAEGGEDSPFESTRYPLSQPLRPDSSHTQEIAVQAPSQPGRYILQVTLEREDRFWSGRMEVTVAQPAPASHEVLTLSEIARWLPLTVIRDGQFANLGFVFDSRPSMLTFVESPRFAAAAAQCPDAACLITSPGLIDRFPETMAIATAENPRQAFFALHNRLATETPFYGLDFDSRIAASAKLHPRCWVDEKNVVIGENVTVGPNATVTGRVRIGDGSVIYPGAVIGSAGFQTSNRSRNPLEMVHAGGVDIGPDCHIFANAVIARGLFRQNTVLGAGCRVGNGAFVSHNCLLSELVFVGHGAVVNGNVRVGARAWIGPGATVIHEISIGADAQISLGATVSRDVPPGMRFTGFLALEHSKMLRTIAAAGKERKS